jgi:hypothetical protein
MTALRLFTWHSGTLDVSFIGLCVLIMLLTIGYVAADKCKRVLHMYPRPTEDKED